MRLLSFILVTGSLVLGLIAAAGAYFAPLRLPDELLVGLTAADTMAAPEAPAGTPPLVGKGQALDAENLRRLRDAGARYVRVEEFSLARWSGRLLFGVACVGLAAGGLVGRWSARRGAVEAEAGRAVDPREALEAADRETSALLDRWPGLGGEAATCAEVIRTLSPVIEVTLPSFAAARPIIVGEIGLGGFAAVMDRFAAAERQFHRAWSAAADGVPEESRECLRRARELLAETSEVLGARRSKATTS